ncbi:MULTISPECIES: hypothetical protein [unclassified Lysinibacillus]|uniref:hypothetical protein n=1 Tax=unclassified Lysinibacillus TaxID=2636778 RepID=UPI001482961A|nr:MULTISPECIES: hypothetical protein [unclassified Lysinibacillus]
MGTRIMPAETMQCKCNVCSKEFHIEEAKFCIICGTKLDLKNAATKIVSHH